MKNPELIEKTYAEAVKGIKEDWLLNSSTDWYDYVVNLPIHLRVTYLVVVLHDQVFNGGFHQYLVNGYGQFVKETIVSLLDIGALKRSTLLETAFKMVNANNVSMEVFRKQILDKTIESLFVTDELYATLDELDIEYYNLVDEELEVLLVSYLESR